MLLAKRSTSRAERKCTDQAACIELAKQSDILTTLPETAARNAIAEGTIEGQPHPGGFRFTIGAAVLYDASREQTVEHFVECL